MPLELEIDDDAKQMPISPRGGHDDARYEHTFADIVSYDDFRFNDMLTQSFDNQPHTIAQSY